MVPQNLTSPLYKASIIAVLNISSVWYQCFQRSGNTRPPNRAFNAQKYSQGELGRRFGRLFLILNTAINQKIQKKNRIIGTLGTSSIYTLTEDLLKKTKKGFHRKSSRDFHFLWLPLPEVMKWKNLLINDPKTMPKETCYFTGDVFCQSQYWLYPQALPPAESLLTLPK